MKLDGQVAIVTGAGRADGMGWAAALALARAGAIVIATGHGRAPAPERFDLGSVSTFAAEVRNDADAAADLEQLGALLAELNSESCATALDVTDAAMVESLVSETYARLGRIDVLFNNAGVAFGAGAFVEMTDDQWRRSLDVNIMGAVNLCRQVLPAMISSGRGSIINNASIAALRGEAGISGYAATKAALVSLTQSLAAEYGPYGVRVNAVCPGAIRTRMGDMEYAFKAAASGCTVTEAVAAIEAAIPLGQLGSAADVADVVLFLASDAARYVTGTSIPVTGGQV
jgi:NAD(P)-dependent dehydrogenase (short-subunit alcohol dehydrogenase family)